MPSIRDVKSNWYYFCSLAKQLDQTTQYVDHSVVAGKIVNGETFSYEFAKILMLAASEFEVIAKQLCSASGLTIRKNASIAVISTAIIGKYPKIGNTVISTPFQKLQPLKDWAVVSDGNEFRVEGLEWWNAHNEVKHDRNLKYKCATLKNCIDAMASLMVLELYLAEVLHCFRDIGGIQCSYFSQMYGYSYVTVDGIRSLPDLPSKKVYEPKDVIWDVPFERRL